MARDKLTNSRFMTVDRALTWLREFNDEKQEPSNINWLNNDTMWVICSELNEVDGIKRGTATYSCRKQFPAFVVSLDFESCFFPLLFESCSTAKPRLMLLLTHCLLDPEKNKLIMQNFYVPSLSLYVCAALALHICHLLCVNNIIVGGTFLLGNLEHI